MEQEPTWLPWARELQAIAQTGLTFSQDPYDLERYRRLRAMAVQMLGWGSAAPLEQLSALFAQDVGYPTPKVAVRGAVFDQDKVLLVREVSDARWALPGGWADVNQSAAQCVEREIQEESGFEVRAIKLAAVWDRRRHGHPAHPYSIYQLFFICELVGGVARPSLETSEIGFFSREELPPLSVGRVTVAQIARMFEHQRDPRLATEFD